MFQALQLMSDAQGVGGRPLWGADVEAALRRLAATLREHYGRRLSDESAGGSSSSGGVAEGAPAAAEGAADAVADAGAAAAADAADARKLAATAEEQAVVLAARRARQLQPQCLKLVKDLLQGQGGAAGGKHD